MLLFPAALVSKLVLFICNMGVAELLAWQAPSIFVLLHLRLINVESLDSETAVASIF